MVKKIDFFFYKGSKLEYYLQQLSSKMSIIAKQLVINKIPLPTDMIYIIKDYCFYNIVEETKKKKLSINHLILGAICQKSEESSEYSYTRWIFGYDFPEWYGLGNVTSYHIRRETLRLEAVSCKICGDYLETSNLRLPSAARCKCYYIEDDLDMVDDNVSVNSDEWMNIY